jgi:hypothetical protein
MIGGSMVMEEIPCCGLMRSTAYCPECGLKLREPNPLIGLLDHCRRQCDSLRPYADNWKQALTRLRDTNSTRRRKQLEKRCRNLAKWEAWVQALESAIILFARNGTPELPP